VTGAGDGAAALKAVRESPPDLMVTDMMMAVTGGNELIKQLRCEPRLRPVPARLSDVHHERIPGTRRTGPGAGDLPVPECTFGHARA